MKKLFILSLTITLNSCVTINFCESKCIKKTLENTDSHSYSLPNNMMLFSRVGGYNYPEIFLTN